MDYKNLQEIYLAFKETFGLILNPVGISCITEKPKDLVLGDKVRICKAILEASEGKTFYVAKENNLCFGASWHLGFNKITDPEILKMIKEFVSKGEKLFISEEAVDGLLSQLTVVPDNSKSVFVVSSLDKISFKPQIVIFVCNPEQACRFLTLALFDDPVMPKIKIGGPTCRMIIMEPILTDQLNISFYDYTARKLCNVEKDKLLVSIPYEKLIKMYQNLDKCSAGKAKIEYPLKFREFLQKRLTNQNTQK